eukprot:CAMPEP_0206610580 /NCGR_PEP_ID=MMETSP0325_2-20121206/54650_1 /ASSEMBLY_ACC=CAM_ASM_000347 /TAXON_ID=2866 /ORGANISM="Crypthecodinium cohnii, Strain Seligo" /LENGTH=31 /DNA_ID= /DNA_START= /DNA_END= /DNA_ORIENTATION=
MGKDRDGLAFGGKNIAMYATVGGPKEIEGHL